MAFRRRRFSRRGFGFGRGSRRGSRYELQALSICRAPLELGLSDCLVPDRFMTPLVTPENEWVGITGGSPFGTGQQVVSPPRVAKGITVRGINIDYAYSYVPTTASPGNEAIGVTTIRSAIVSVPLIGFGPSQPDPHFLSGNPILFSPETTTAVGSGASFIASRYRILWRGQDILMTNLVGADDSLFVRGLQIVPQNGPFTRRIRVKTAITLDMEHALFWYVEAVNPFLAENPTVALDLMGYAAIKPAWTGNRYK